MKEDDSLANHRFRVRRNTRKGVEVVGFFDSITKATTLAAKRMRETGMVYRVERRIPMESGWETAMELVPETGSPIEAAIARGRLPKVQDGAGRKGQVLSYIRPTHEVRVAWLDSANSGAGDVVKVDQLSLR